MIEFEKYLRYERQLSDLTIRNYLVYTKHFQKFLSQGQGLFAHRELNKVNRQDISNFLGSLRNRVSMSSTSQYIVALRCYYKWAYYILRSKNLGEVSFFLENIVRLRRNQAVVAVPTREEVDKLRNVLNQFLQLNSWNKGSLQYRATLRAYVIIELLASSGIRSNELKNLERQDINLDERIMLIKKGKGGYQRESIFGKNALALLKEYFEIYNFAPSERIFSPHDNFIYRIVRTWANKARINPKIHPHSFRHYFITESEKLNIPLQTTADQVGHRDLNTTRNHYRHLGTEYLRNAYDGKVI